MIEALWEVAAGVARQARHFDDPRCVELDTGKISVAQNAYAEML